jgi:hypothetical protein
MRTMGLASGKSKWTCARAIIAATLVSTLSTSVAWALSESPAPGASPAAAAAPAPAPSSTSPAGAPATKLVPSDETEPPAAAPASEAGAAAGATPKPARKHHKAVSAAPPEVEPASARLRVSQSGWIYAAPSKTSKKLEMATIGKFVDVTGSTKYYLQAKLKSGQTGYISPSQVDLVKPIDKTFMLTQDAAVLDAPNRWAKKLAEVHSKHDVHVIGIALNYMRIRMKSGLTGFIPVTAMQ